MGFNYTIIQYFLFIYFHSYTTTIFVVSEGNGSTTSTPIIQCIQTERKALKIFRENLVDSSGRLSSWDSDNCCSWKGITCDNNTGHVTTINLRNPQRSRYGDYDSDYDEKASLGSKLSISLLELKYLSHLDLSLNDFRGNPIPEFLGELKRLIYLNLACSNFSGIIPPQLGNLTNLQSLDLYSLSFNSLSTKSLHWLTNLSSLKYLNLGGVALSSDWLPSLSKLHFLLDLNLYACDLNTTFSDNLPSVNFTSLVRLNMSLNGMLRGSHLSWLSDLTSLEVLDLSNNYDLVGPIPTLYADLRYLDLSDTDLSVDLYEILLGFQKMSNLQYLNLFASNISGSIPTFVDKFSSLRMLDLSGNNLIGSIPTSIGNLISLRKFDLSQNMMNGNIPESLGRLSQLIELYLDSNNWRGILTEAHLISLGSLKSFTLTTDPPMSLAFNVTYDWVPPFNLKVLDIENCLVGPAFSVWLQKQRSLTSVVLQNTGISDIIPDNWFSFIASDLTYLDLSSNKIRGTLPRRLEFPNLSVINLSYNQFKGEFPYWSATATTELYLQENLFSKSLPQDIGDLMPRLFELDLSWNLFDSIIPSSLCKMTNMEFLLLRNNKFSGDIPDCWDKAEMIWALDLSNNRLSGMMPTSFGNSSLGALFLGNNNLHGKIMNTSANIYSSLMILDLGENNFSGSLPEQMNEVFSNLLMVVLRDNFFSGNIPPGFCKFEILHYFDLSWNNFSGTIPKCINNLTALVDISPDAQIYNGVSSGGLLNIRTKGNEYEYGRTASFVNGIDLSGNFLSGEIPVQMTNLKVTSILNLSRNHLSGKIPHDIGNMISLETLDLSCNHLSGPIPPSLSSPTFLSHLNLSYNNLEGRIPSGNELQTLTDPSIYEGNPMLCGTPLPNRCPGDPETTDVVTQAAGVHEEEQDKNENEDVWFYLVIALGFIVGFWSVCGTLVLNNSWRDAFFKFFGRIKPLQSLMD